jgi:LytS/YehU family sensor histidine kinase
VDPAVHAERLPQFLLLPLVENAIKYGGQTSPGTLVVAITVAREHGLLVCSVANTGRWLAPEPRNRLLAKRTPAASTRIGLDNLRERLTRHYGPACAYEIDASSEPGWVRITLRLPEPITTHPPRSASRDPFADKLP